MAKMSMPPKRSARHLAKPLATMKKNKKNNNLIQKKTVNSNEL